MENDEIKWEKNDKSGTIMICQILYQWNKHSSEVCCLLVTKEVIKLQIKDMEKLLKIHVTKVACQTFQNKLCM